MKKTLKIFGQVITGIIILSLGILLINFTVPGHWNFCDADQIYMYYFGLLFIVITIGFLINSVIFLVKKQWIKYRIIAISLTLLIGLLILLTRSIMTKTIYGKTLHTITNQDDAYTLIKIRMFKNHKFISETYDMSCNVENTGTYKLTDNELTLKFNGEKSEYLESRYRLKNDTLISLESENYKLIMNKN
ncbi:hypothetical protein [Labilibacter marinus]|uniref:hypothetical protein n=1 Tax=Labilibacter marinus TaxID=1477105 RepID=UPI00082DEB6F|nr:hypothetical protein [Labilibacter marinus]